MTSKKRLAALLLCAVMIASALISCGGDGSAAPAATTSSEAAVTEAEVTTDPNDRSGYKDSLPDDLDFGGETVTVYSIKVSGTDYARGADEPTGDIVVDTVIERNQKVCERLNISLNIIDNDIGYDAIGTAINKLVMAGDNTYDYFFAQQFGTVAQATKGIYYNVYELPYIDFEQPWWWNDYMDEISIGKDKRFFLVGDYFIDMLRGTGVLFFNKDMYRNLKGDPNELYQEVFDQKWTLEKMASLVSDCYNDLNGDSQKNTEDQYGFVSYATYSASDRFAFATDIHLTERNEDGTMAWTMGTERQLKAAELINNVFWNDGSFVCDASADISTPIFIEGRSLTLGNATISNMESDGMRSMQADFGMIPNPKLDEVQANYRSLVHDTMKMGVVPITCAKPELVGAVIEAMSAESWKSLMPAYYETALKVKYVRDDASAQMMDIIHDSISTEFAFVYYATLNNAGQIYRTLVSNKSSDFMSTWAKLEKGATKSLDKLNAAYLENVG